MRRCLSSSSRRFASHHNAVFLVRHLVVPALGDLAPVPGRRDVHRRASAGGGPDRRDAVPGPFVAGVSGLDVPHVGLQGVAAASDAHLCEVAHSILGFCESYIGEC